jgi:hypothetical protein
MVRESVFKMLSLSVLFTDAVFDGSRRVGSREEEMKHRKTTAQTVSRPIETEAGGGRKTS